MNRFQYECPFGLRTTPTRRIFWCLLACAAGNGCALPKLTIDENYDAAGSSAGGDASNSSAQGGRTSTGGASTRPSSGGANTGGANTGGANAGGANTGGANTGGSTARGGAPSQGGGTSAGGTSTVATNSGGSSAKGGASSQSGTSPSVCLGTALPMREYEGLTTANNGCGMIGDWYLYKDDGNTTASGPVSTRPTDPMVVGGGKICMSGTTSVGTFAVDWGAGIGIDFNKPASVVNPYNATNYSIGGFELVISGTFPQGLRLTIPRTRTGTADAYPFIAITRAGTFRAMFADAFVPGSWDASDGAGLGVDAANLKSMQFAIVGGTTNASYNFCVESIVPLPVADNGSLGVKPVQFVPIALNATATIAPASNTAAIQGSFFCSQPPNSSITCGESTTSLTNPYRVSSKSMCAKGVFDGTSANWGATVGFDLNQASGTVGPYAIASKKLRGFRIDTSQTTGVGAMRIGYRTTATVTSSTIAPFAEFPKPGLHVAEFGTIACPNWTNFECSYPEPLANLYSTFVQFVPSVGSGTLANPVNFDLCLTSVEAILEK